MKKLSKRTLLFTIFIFPIFCIAQNPTKADTLYIAYSDTINTSHIFSIDYTEGQALIRKLYLNYLLTDLLDDSSKIEIKNIDYLLELNNPQLKIIGGVRKNFCLNINMEFPTFSSTRKNLNCRAPLQFYNVHIRQEYQEDFLQINTLIKNVLKERDKICDTYPCPMPSKLQYDICMMKREEITQKQVIYLDDLVMTIDELPNATYLNSNILRTKLGAQTVVYFLIDKDDEYYYFEEVDYMFRL